MRSPVRSTYSVHSQALFAIFLFFLLLFYLLTQVFDVFLFHFIFDIHLPVIAMVVVMAGLAPFAAGYASSQWQGLKSLILVLTSWSMYLAFNSLFGLNLRSSFVILFRFIGSWLIALELGVILQQKQNKAFRAIGAALLMGLLAITLVWHLQSQHPEYLRWLQFKIRDSNDLAPSELLRRSSLYVNPNILGFALVVHAALLIWYTFGRISSLFVIPFAWAIALFGILKSQSTNALIGLVSVGVLALFTYFKLFWEPSGRRQKSFMLIGLFLFLAVGTTLISLQDFGRILDRFSKDRSKNTVYGWYVYDNTPPGARITRTYDEDLQSHVIELRGAGTDNGYILDFEEPVVEQEKFILQWSIKSSEDFVVYVHVATNSDPMFLCYTSTDDDPPGDQTYIMYGIGSHFKSGRWHTATRNLQEDLQKSRPTLRIKSVLFIFVRGNVRIDEIELTGGFHRTFEEDGLSKQIEDFFNSIDQTRVYIWKSAFRYWSERPWLGIGLGSFQHTPVGQRHYHCHSFLYNLWVEQGVLGFGFLLVFCAMLIYQMRSWSGVTLLACFFFSQLFEDESLQFCLPIYLSFILGYCFYCVLERRNVVSANNRNADELR